MGISIEPTASSALVPTVSRRIIITPLVETNELPLTQPKATEEPSSGNGKGTSNAALARLQTNDTKLLRLLANYNVPQKIVLPNGLTIITDPIPNALSCHLQVCVNVGSMHEKPDENGIAHFVEHMLFKGTKSRTVSDIKKEMESFGDTVNAQTGGENTCYYGQFLSEDVPQALRFFLDMLFNSTFPESEFETERKVVLEEVKKYKDSPEEYIGDLASQNCTNGHPYGRPVQGTIKSVSNLSRDSLLRFVNDFYTFDNMTISLVGNFSTQELVEVINEFERDNPHIARKKKEVNVDPLTVNRGVLIKNRQLEQTHLVFTAKGISMLDKDRHTFNIIDAALCDGFSSRLFQEIREKRGLAYEVSSSSAKVASGGIFGVYTAIPGEDISCVLEIILREVEDIKKKGLKEEELQAAKNKLIVELILELDDMEKKADGNATDDLYFGRCIPLEESIRRILSVTNEDVIRLANEIFDPKYFGLTVLGPKKELPKGFEAVFKQS